MASRPSASRPGTISTAAIGRLLTSIPRSNGKNSDRPALDKALAAARLHRASLVVSKVDRLTRSVAFLSRLLEAGVDVRFADLPQIEGATGRFMLQQMVAVAELEAGMISARTKAALAAAKKRGKKLGGNRGVKPTAKMRALSKAALQQRAAAGRRTSARRSKAYRRPGQPACGPSQTVSTASASRQRVGKAPGRPCRLRASLSGWRRRRNTAAMERIVLASILCLLPFSAFAEDGCIYANQKFSVGSTRCDCPSIKIENINSTGEKGQLTSRRLSCSKDGAWVETTSLCVEMTGLTTRPEFYRLSRMYCPMALKSGRGRKNACRS